MPAVKVAADGGEAQLRIRLRPLKLFSTNGILSFTVAFPYLKQAHYTPYSYSCSKVGH